MAIRTSFDKIPYGPQRLIFSYLTNKELNETAQTCKRVLENVSHDEVGLRARAASRGVKLLSNMPALIQLQDRNFERELHNRLISVKDTAEKRKDRVYPLMVGIFCDFMISATVTSSAPLSYQACAVAGNIPLLVNKPKNRINFGRLIDQETPYEIGILALGAIQLTVGYVTLFNAFFSENLHGYRFSMALIGTGGMTCVSMMTERERNFFLRPSLLQSVTRNLDETCSRAYITSSARAERAMRRSSCCLKVSSTLGAIKRYAAEKLFGLMRIAASPL